MLRKVIGGVLALLLVVIDLSGGITSLPTATAAQTPPISLNGRADTSENGYLDAKSVVLSAGEETRINYRLTPGYGAGTQIGATGVTVTIFLPSLAYIDGEYHVVSRNAEPTPMGVQGRVTAGNGWIVRSNTTVQGGPIVMEYDGDLRAGSNPAFDIHLTTYHDHSDGPYGAIPEGTVFELNGFVSYEMFERVEGTSWSTPGNLDDDSRVSLISSDLHWEAAIDSHVADGSSDLVPLWDRYQYIDYLYTLENTSDNLASNIDDYSVTFDIDSTATNVNGIIPFDVNRWKPNPDGPPTENPDLDDTSGQFVGVPDQGGILIYDVTQWDGQTELTNPIPYSYSGTGMISIDREEINNGNEITPPGADGPSEKKYLLSLPLSRQGFPNPPANFKVSAITDVVFAQEAHWSKTSLSEREIATPTYDFTYTHNTKQNETVYGYETYNEISSLRSNSNAPIFNPEIRYSVDKDFTLDRVVYEFDQVNEAAFENAEITYAYTDPDTNETVTETLTDPTRTQDDDAGTVTLTFNLSHLADLEWDYNFTATLTDQVAPMAALPVNVKIFGAPYRVGEMTAEANVVTTEKIASNDDFGQNTTYTEVEHEYPLNADITVIYPEEVVPTIAVDIAGQGDTAVSDWNEPAELDFLFGINGTVAENSTTTLHINEDAERIQDITLTLREALFTQADNIRAFYTTLSGETGELDLSAHTGTGDFSIELPAGIATAIIHTGEITSDGPESFATITGRVGHQLDKQHTVTAQFRTYQPKPYDKDTYADTQGTIQIRLPNELLPEVAVTGIYGDRETQDKTRVSYESTFDVEYQLTTGGVTSPQATYTIDLLPASKSGQLEFNNLTLHEAFINAVDDYTVTIVDAAGKTQTFTQPQITATELDLDNPQSITITSTSLSLDELQTIATIEYAAHIEIGSHQTVRATFTGTQQAPYEDTATATANNVIEIGETRTTVDVKGVNQVVEQLGAGNKYSVDIYRHWGRGYTYNKEDFTLDQGYKSLGGFTTSFTRPTNTYDNHNQRLTLNVDLPQEHFDLYYLKIRSELQEHIDTVDIYRMVDGEEVLWKTVLGAQWVENTQENSGFWRIATARPDNSGAALFATYNSINDSENHPYYKDAWDNDVHPEAPVSRVAVNLEFTRENNNATPQLAGTTAHAIEYMGRFHSSSVDGKKPTLLTSTDTFGTRTKLERTHNHSVNSLVGYPFAQTRTGAQDNTSLSNKVISMGEVGEYLASIWNVNNASWAYYTGHGPDIYTPAASEYDEWLGMRDPASFHDEMIYEFVYPTNPNQDSVYNLTPTHITIPDTSTLKYLTGVRATDENDEAVTLHFSQPLTQQAHFEYDPTQPRGIHDNGDGTFTISLGTDEDTPRYPQTFEAIFEHVPGFGERTAEIDGITADSLGANLNEIDVRVGGVVNGNKALTGTTNLYRVPADTQQKTRMHTSSASLTGRTPKLGAKLDIGFDHTKVYDYQADGITPQTTEVRVEIENNSEADIKDVFLAITPDGAYRTQVIAIPAEIFAADWAVESVTVKQGNTNTALNLEDFVLNTETGNYEFDLLPLFNDGTLDSENLDLTLGGHATVVKRHIDSIGIQFTPANVSIGLWGSLSRELDPTLPARMAEDASVYLTGIWVDEPANDGDTETDPWDSKPSFVNENTKSRNEIVSAYSTFTAEAEVTAYQPIYTSAGTGNNGANPKLTRNRNSGAPNLYNRVARLQTHGIHLQNDYTPANNTHLFYSPGTNTQIDYTNIAVGDTVKVLYELKNIGQTATENHGAGSLPVHRPVAHVEAPIGLRISSVTAATPDLNDANLRAVIADTSSQELEVDTDAVAITDLNPRRSDINFDLTLNDGDSVFFVVEYTATNDYSTDLGDTQNKTLRWNVYARPDYSHHYMSYDSTGINGNRTHGTTATVNFDGDSIVEHLGHVRNTNYRYANPNQLVINSEFDSENVSGQAMTLTVENIRNEILHDNTRLDLYLALDRDDLSGFELTQLPKPQYPEGFTGQFDAPRVYYQNLEGEWVLVDDTTPAHPLAEINNLWVEYGVVPAVDGDTTFEAPSFQIPGIGHWQARTTQTAKYYDLYSQAEIVLTHEDTSGTDAATYTYRSDDRVRIYKAIPTVEFNIQSFDNLSQAVEPYDGAEVGKTSYRPGDELVYKLTAKNHTTNQGTATNTPYGKAPLLQPVIYDRLPEYVTAPLLTFVTDGTLNVADAIDAGALEIRVTDNEDHPRPYELPIATVTPITGLDIAGAQQFSNDRHNDGWGLLSSAEPSNTDINPATEINFDLITYEFEEEQLGRGEQIEIIYPAQIREHNLPVATYQDGTAVFAPLFGWYSANQPVASNAANTTMDMAALLHDAGISGNRGHEMTESEFLSNSYSWLPGDNTRRRRPENSSTSTQATYYDASANTQTSHRAYLNEEATNDLHTAFNASALDDNFQWVIKNRVQNDNTDPARILWSQDGIQLARAWLYGASEMLPDTQRNEWGTDAANFYEHDGSLNSYNRHRLNYTPYVEDDYTYAVELHEEFTVRLHAANLGDHQITSGLEYVEVLPVGITPYDTDGNLLGVTAYDGTNSELPASVEIIQTPQEDNGYRAPAQSQEARTYTTDTREDGIPYVVKISVTETLPGMFNNPGAAVTDKYQHVDIRVRVEGELPPSADGLSYWHDEFTLTTVEPEAYLEIYDHTYGGFDRGIGTYNLSRYPNDGMAQGIDVTDLAYRFSANRTSYFAVEPWGMYIRGLNAQATATETPDARPALVTGDQIAMRKPTLRVWSAPEKDEYIGDYDTSIEDFSVDLYEEFTIHSTVENQQLEVLGEYNRVSSGYNRYSGDNYNDDIWVNAPQTIGGARGSWFEPSVTIALPYGIAPVTEDGTPSRYYTAPADHQSPVFTAVIHDITYDSSTPVADVTEFFDVEVEVITHPHGQQFVLHFTTNTDKAADVAYGQSLVISPRVATIDTPLFNADSDDARYQQVLTFANTSRPVFNPIVSNQYVTGAPTSLTARDQGNTTRPNNIKSSNGKSITANDRTRRDTTSVWNTNMGALKITEPLISPTQSYEPSADIPVNSTLGTDGETTVNATVPGSEFIPTPVGQNDDKFGAYGGTFLNLRKPSLTNTTQVANFADSHPADLVQVDAAGKYWYSTQVANAPMENENPYEEIKTAGHVHNSRFVITHFVTDFALATGEVRIRVGEDLYDRTEFEAAGYTVERHNSDNDPVDPTRNRIQWLVTPPAGDRGTAGQLLSGTDFELLYEVQLIDGYEDAAVSDEDTWASEDLIVDSYVSLITDDPLLIPANGPQDPKDFIVQSLASMEYHAYASDTDLNFDVNGDGELTGLYAADSAEVEILKPRAEVRINTTKPRIAYSNGMSGDTYFNSSDVIEYLITHGENTGSGLKEFVIEHILPTHESNDPNISVSHQPIVTTALYATTGAWQLPEETIDRLAARNIDIDDAFRTYLYVSNEPAETGYETTGWQLLNPGGTSILTNETFTIPASQRSDLRKVRVVVKALLPDEFLVPQGTRLNIDADPDTEGAQSVTETDPDNHATDQFPTSVTDAAITIGMRASSDARSTLFIYGTAEAWGNYVATNVTNLAQSETRSYLTPSRPVINVRYDALYYRTDATQDPDLRYGWSDNVAIAPKSSPHLKFSGQFINADENMWSRDEDNTYAKDTLVDPFITFELPAVLETGDFTYVPFDDVTPDHPLNDEFRSRYALTNQENNLWTWRILRADGSPASTDSQLSHTNMHAGPWPGHDKNLLSVWFEGNVYPGDMIVVDFIGSVDAYAPGQDAQDLKSRATITNNTGLLYPLNSQQNASNRLGYTTDALDFSQNGQVTDRLVFSEKQLFQYETYDDFGKRKIAYSDLNQAGTVSPELTPVREGGEFFFEVSVNNSKSVSQSPYPYPIIYDVLPHEGDTSITNPEIARGSNFSAWLQPDSVVLEREGTDEKIYTADEYTVYVGPFTKRDGEIVDAPMVSHTDAAIESFYDAVGEPGKPSTVRDAHFVELSEVADSPDVLKRAKTILVLFNDPQEELPGQSKLKFTYAMKAPLNAPAFLEQFHPVERREEVSLWNSFMATQRVDAFMPQESNQAGALVTEQADRVYIGNYVWNDVNYNGTQDEGTRSTDTNGRELLEPSKDLNFNGEIDDPGINGVQVSLLTPAGYNVDTLGNPIHHEANEWRVVDETTGTSVLDEVFGQPITSAGPLVTLTETDYHGNDGYYTFSNIPAGTYRVLFEFPSEYDKFSLTTTKVFQDTNLDTYLPGEALNIPAAVDNDRLVAVSQPALIDTETTDSQRMSFDVGIAQTVLVGGTIFEENIETLDGYQDTNEPGLAGYHVYFKNTDGETVTDHNGEPLLAITDTDGTYEFTVLPIDREYFIEVTDENDSFNPEMVVSPFVHNVDPFTEKHDNDGFVPKDTQIVKTNPLRFDLEGLFATNFADRDTVSVGFYAKTTYGVIGNRVWHDLNRDGIQDPNEPGIAGQELLLKQYIYVDEEWQLTDYEQTTTTNSDGFYYFAQVPSVVREDGHSLETKYEVVVEELVPGYTFTKTHEQPVPGPEAAERDSDFFPNGTLHPTDNVGDHLVSVAERDETTGVIHGLTDNTIDLGLVDHARSTLSGAVFIDTDRDGLKNDTETPDKIYTATLEVRYDGEWVTAQQDDDGKMIEPRFTSDNHTPMTLEDVSDYVFENLHIIDSIALTPYEYRVRVTEIPRWQEVTQLQTGTDPAIDNDFTQLKDHNDVTHIAFSDVRILGELQTGQLHPIDTFTDIPATHVDLGVFNHPTQAVISGTLWNDENQDGFQNDTETGLPEVRAVLNRVVDGELVFVAETTTDSGGLYEFTVDASDYVSGNSTFHVPHTYVVEFVLTSRQSLAPTEQDGDPTQSRFTPLTLNGELRYTHNITDPQHTALSDEFTIVAIDDEGYAVYETVTDETGVDGGVITHDTIKAIGDTIFEDLDADGTQSANEPGIPGLTVRLFRLNHETGSWEPHTDTNGASSLVTDANGKYEFSIEVADLNKNSPHYRAAYEYRVLVEAPSHMRLVEENSPFSYTEGNAPEGVTIDRPFSYVLSTPVTLIETGSEGTELGTEHHARFVDAGFQIYERSTTIGGRIWEDTNLNGIQDNDEPGIEDQTVYLWEHVDGQWVQIEDLNGRGAVETDAAGQYEFTVSPTHYDESAAKFLQPREYRVTTQKHGYQEWAPLHAGIDPAIDSDVEAAPTFGTGNTGATQTFNIIDAPGGVVDVSTIRTDHHMGIGVKTYGTSSIIGGRIWEDTNLDGIQNDNEVGLQGQHVYLWELVDGDWVQTTDLNDVGVAITDAEGNYGFEVSPTHYDETHENYLAPRHYKVTTQKHGYQEWAPLHEGDDPTVDSDVEPGPNFGTINTGVTQTFDIITATDGVVDVSTIRDERHMGIGVKTYETSVTLGGRVWEDTNLDGIQDEDERGIADQVVHLWELVDDEWVQMEDLNGVGAVATDTDGRYEFVVSPTHYDETQENYLTPREYRVTTQKHGYQEWAPLHEGDDPTVDSDVEPGADYGTINTGVTQTFDIVTHTDGVIDIASLNDDLQMGIGLRTHETSVTVGGRIWEDTNQDGIQNDDEENHAGQAVQLWELVAGEWVPVEDLNGNNVVETDMAGRYEFTVSPTHYDESHENYLTPREYRVTTQKHGYQEWAPLHEGDDPTVDSDVEPGSNFGTINTGVTQSFNIIEMDDGSVNITSLTDDTYMDIGVKTHASAATISGQIWVDTLPDGEHQSNEITLEGHPVQLWELVDNEWVKVEDLNGISESTTDTDGHYEFMVSPTHYDETQENYLAPRQYRTTIELPNGYEVSTGSKHTQQDGTVVISQTAQIVDTDNNSIDITSVANDPTLNFPLTPVPAVEELGQTGAHLAALFVGLTFLAAGAALIRGVRTRRA